MNFTHWPLFSMYRVITAVTFMNTWMSISIEFFTLCSECPRWNPPRGIAQHVWKIRTYYRCLRSLGLLHKKAPWFCLCAVWWPTWCRRGPLQFGPNNVLWKGTGDWICQRRQKNSRTDERQGKVITQVIPIFKIWWLWTAKKALEEPKQKPQKIRFSPEKLTPQTFPLYEQIAQKRDETPFLHQVKISISILWEEQRQRWRAFKDKVEVKESSQVGQRW